MDIPTTLERPTQVAGTDLASMIEGAIGRAFDKSPTARLAQEAETPAPQPQLPEWIARLGQSASVEPDYRPKKGDVLVMDAEHDWHRVDQGQIVSAHNYAEQSQGLMDLSQRLDGALGFEIPWGAILFGALPAAVVAELIDGFMPPVNDEGGINFVNPVLKVGAAAIAVPLARSQLGRPAAMAVAIVFGVQVLSTVLPLDRWVQRFADWLRGLGGNDTATQGGGVTTQTGVRDERQTEMRQLPVREARGGNPITARLRGRIAA